MVSESFPGEPPPCSRLGPANGRYQWGLGRQEEGETRVLLPFSLAGGGVGADPPLSCWHLPTAPPLCPSAQQAAPHLSQPLGSGNTTPCPGAAEVSPLLLLVSGFPASCVASQLFNHLGDQLLVLNSVSLKYLQWFQFSWLDPGWYTW